jgi:hypothetical protein
MGTTICLFLLGYGLYRMVKATPSAIKFGLEHPDAVRGGANMLKRVFRK